MVWDIYQGSDFLWQNLRYAMPSKNVSKSTMCRSSWRNWQVDIHLKQNTRVETGCQFSGRGVLQTHFESWGVWIHAHIFLKKKRLPGKLRQDVVEWDDESFCSGQRAKSTKSFNKIQRVLLFFCCFWTLLGCDIGGAKELGVMYFPTSWGAKEPQNLPNHRVVCVSRMIFAGTSTWQVAAKWAHGSTFLFKDGGGENGQRVWGLKEVLCFFWYFWGDKLMFGIFYPENWGDDSIWRAWFFQNGCFNHQVFIVFLGGWGAGWEWFKTHFLEYLSGRMSLWRCLDQNVCIVWDCKQVFWLFLSMPCAEGKAKFNASTSTAIFSVFV